jgi:hypothetical protein
MGGELLLEPAPPAELVALLGEPLGSPPPAAGTTCSPAAAARTTASQADGVTPVTAASGELYKLAESTVLIN